MGGRRPRPRRPPRLRLDFRECVSHEFFDFLAVDLDDEVRHLRAPPCAWRTEDDGPADLTSDPGPRGRPRVGRVGGSRMSEGEDDTFHKSTGLESVRSLQFSDTTTLRMPF